jgi:hypothetical protein
MAKYYVTSGELEELIISDDPRKACISAFKKFIERKNDNEDDKTRLGFITTVSESGFSTITSKDIIFETQAILEALGVAEHYKVEERDIKRFLTSKRGQIISSLSIAETNLMSIIEHLKDHDLEDEFIFKLTEIQELTRRVAIYDDESLDEPAEKIEEE